MISEISYCVIYWQNRQFVIHNFKWVKMNNPSIKTRTKNSSHIAWISCFGISIDPLSISVMLSHPSIYLLQSDSHSWLGRSRRMVTVMIPFTDCCAMASVWHPASTMPCIVWCPLSQTVFRTSAKSVSVSLSIYACIRSGTMCYWH